MSDVNSALTHSPQTEPSRSAIVSSPPSACCMGMAIVASRFTFVLDEAMTDVYGEVQTVDRPPLKGVQGRRISWWI